MVLKHWSCFGIRQWGFAPRLAWTWPLTPSRWRTSPLSTSKVLKRRRMSYRMWWSSWRTLRNLPSWEESCLKVGIFSSHVQFLTESFLLFFLLVIFPISFRNPPGGSSRNREDPIGPGCGRRGRRAVLLRLRVRVRWDVCGCWCKPHQEPFQ